MPGGWRIQPIKAYNIQIPVRDGHYTRWIDIRPYKRSG